MRIRECHLLPSLAAVRLARQPFLLDIVFETPHGELSRILVTAQGLGMVDVALTPHLDLEHHPYATLANAEAWAATLPVPTYSIDDQTAIKVVDDTVEVVSEGH